MAVIRPALNLISPTLRKFWRGLRDWCGDSAYDRYLRSPATRSNRCQRLTAKQFYVEQLNRRYSRPNRCC